MVGEQTFDGRQDAVREPAERSGARHGLAAARIEAIELSEQILERVCMADCDWSAVAGFAGALRRLADALSRSRPA